MGALSWPEEALRANIIAQVSLALNRIWTEWYPSRGYSFNITGSPGYDQAYVNGRTVFAVMERLTAELGRGQREGKALGILWLDIDYFKEINDSHGHALGDQVLKQVAAIISATIRSYDVAARWGGDEFLVLVYPTDQQHLDSLGERLRAAIASSRAVLDAKGQPLAMSVSIGGYVATPGEELDHVLQAGDEALYAAKEAGRNAYRAAG